MIIKRIVSELLVSCDLSNDGQILWYKCLVPDDFPEQTLGQIDLRFKYKATALAVAGDRGRNKNLAPMGETLVQPGDVIIIACREEFLKNSQ